MTHAAVIGSKSQSRQFGISYSQPVPKGGAYLGELTVSAEGYRHSISAFGGFDEASFQIVGDLQVFQDWYENGVGRGIKSYTHELLPMWEGFVNQITVQQAGLTLTRGPLVSLQNRLKAIYSQVDTTTTPPTPGLRLETPFADDLESQLNYGIWVGILSVAGVTDDNALQLRDSHLAEFSKLGLERSYVGRSNQISIKVDCLGYSAALIYPYNQKVVTGEIALSEKMKAVLAADPNAWISTDTSGMAYNGIQVKAWEADDHQAISLLRGLTAVGDTNETRYLFGIYEDRKPDYRPAPIDWEYELRLGDARNAIRHRSGGEAPDWSIRPGKWIFFSDFFPGLFRDPNDLGQDPRMLFIESIEFDLLNGAVFNGGKVSRTSQKLARLGLNGFDV